MTMVSKGWLEKSVAPARLVSSGETEPGSAGKQPGEGYPDRWCAKGAASPWQQTPSGALSNSTFGHHRHALENPTVTHLDGRKLRLGLARKAIRSTLAPNNCCGRA